ncbi:MAG: hypothetical protein Q7T62_07290 [Undibacterium sp.]|nr:hypothetical protein [Undibacterium sp.]
MQTNKFDYAMAMSVARCFNVAAICALAIWHGYAFYLNQAIARSPASQTIELKLQETPAAVTARNGI